MTKLAQSPPKPAETKPQPEADEIETKVLGESRV